MNFQKPAVKVWDAKRIERRSVPYKHDAQLTVKDVITRAGTKLGIRGHSLVLEGGGTWIDDDDSLICFKDGVLICLASGEKWYPASAATDNDGSSSHSTDSENSASISNGDVQKNGARTQTIRDSRTPLSDISLNSCNQNSISSSCTSAVSGKKVCATTSSDKDREYSIAFISPSNCDSEVIQQLYSISIEDSDDDSSNEDDDTSTDKPRRKQHNQLYADFVPRLSKLRSDIEQELNGWQSKNLKMRKDAVKRARIASSQLIIGEVRMIGHHVDKDKLKRVARTLRDTWPIVFEDKSDGVREGEGISTFERQLRSRNNYCNHLERSEAKKKLLATSIAERNELLYVKIGCTNWQPVNDLSKEDVGAARKYLLGYK
ncbi:hypothetical protein QAD02_017612 [Eretmocerus hayati]|uniref:Uncharacterized protein n=1 Tax=Eretmocerus hayati TaxID=131215 RepID=A0ACC2PE28_9HYME|nr:hypothetical protein QAD02_017612 [Eretmocerus hayati]